MGWRERWAHWAVDHGLWDLLLALIVWLISRFVLPRVPYFGTLEARHLALILIGIFVASVVLFDRILWRWYKVEEIRFDYVPDSLLNHGWKIAYGVPGDNAKWTASTDGPSTGCISIRIDESCAIERNFPPNTTLADRVVYDARYTGTTMLFFMVKLAPVDGSSLQHKWIKIVVGQYRRPQPAFEWNEWVLPMKGKPLKNGWRRFDIRLVDAVRKTWGTIGLKFVGVTVIRIRGNLDISPIQLYEEAEPRFFGTKTAQSPAQVV